MRCHDNSFGFVLAVGEWDEKGFFLLFFQFELTTLVDLIHWNMNENNENKTTEKNTELSQNTADEFFISHFSRRWRRMIELNFVGVLLERKREHFQMQVTLQNNETTNKLKKNFRQFCQLNKTRGNVS